MRILRIVFFVFFACSVLIAQVAPQNSADCKLPLPVGLTPIGTPLWKPVDFHVFTAAVGTPDDNFAEFRQNQTNLLYPLRHQSCAELGIGPGAAHQPPYRQEMEAGMDIMTFRDSLDFFKKDFTTPNGVCGPSGWSCRAPEQPAPRPISPPGQSFPIASCLFKSPEQPTATTSSGIRTSQLQRATAHRGTQLSVRG
jgi:hypothetical protein